MGLDFVPGNAHWSYGGFHEFRKDLAIEEGFVLDEMIGFKHGTKSWDDIVSPLKPLLNHSDCEGKLTVEECVQILPRFHEILRAWNHEILRARNEEAESNPMRKYNVLQGEKLASAMLEVIASGTPLEFC